jgi:hypothetical protein
MAIIISDCIYLNTKKIKKKKKKKKETCKVNTQLNSMTSIDKY